MVFVLGTKNLHYRLDYRKYILLVLPIFLLASCHPLKEVEKLIEYNFLDKQLIIVPNVIVNDSIKGDFIFDSGSNHTIINLKKVKNNVSKSKTITDFYGNTDKISILKKNSIRIANFNLVNLKLRAYDLSILSKKYNIIGILGTDIISKFSWKFDYNNKKLLISNKPFKNDTLSFINVDFNNKSLIKDKIKINGIYKNDFILDSGSLSEINTNDSLLALKDSTNFIEQNLIRSLASKNYKNYKIYLSYNSKIDIGIHKFNDCKLQAESNSHNLIGLDFFSRTIFVFDGIASKFYFHSQAKIDKLIKNRRGLRFGLDENDNIFVEAITEKGESYLKGIKIGDIIVGIDKLNIFTYKKRIEELNQLRNSINELSIERNNTILHFKFDDPNFSKIKE